MRKLILLGSIAAAAGIAAPAAANDGNEARRAAARQTCLAGERCTEPRRAFPWFFRGQDEGAQVRRPLRKLALHHAA